MLPDNGRILVHPAMVSYVLAYSIQSGSSHDFQGLVPSQEPDME